MGKGSEEEGTNLRLIILNDEGQDDSDKPGTETCSPHHNQEMSCCGTMPTTGRQTGSRTENVIHGIEDFRQEACSEANKEENQNEG